MPIKECCKQVDNLIYQLYDGRQDLSVHKCKICGCRHFELIADKGNLGLKGSRM